MDHFIIQESCSTLRAIGREALQGKWKHVVLGMLVFQGAALIPQIVLTVFFPNAPGVGTLYTFLVSGPLTLGYSIFALNIFRKKEAKISQIFYGFEQFGKSLGVFILIFLIIVLWSLIAIPGVFLAAMVPLLFPLAIAACVPAIVVSLRYEQAFFVLADAPQLRIGECVARSRELMTGNKMKLFLMNLSFIGWMALASIPVFAVAYSQALRLLNSGMMAPIDIMANYSTGADWALMLPAMIPMLWVLAYMMATEAGFYELLCGNLRPGVVQTTAEVIESTVQISQPDFQPLEEGNIIHENPATEHADVKDNAPKINLNKDMHK